jgi:(4S)-4-hydroxy-5-phosphonooxypentane-2,3-dione isomerase
MYGGMIKLVAHAGRKTELLEFLRWDAEVARAQEPGTLRFDVWQVPDEPDAVYLYEVLDQAAFEAHQKSEPFKKFVAEIVPNVIEPVIFVLPFAESTVSITES